MITTLIQEVTQIQVNCCLMYYVLSQDDYNTKSHELVSFLKVRNYPIEVVAAGHREESNVSHRTALHMHHIGC